MAATKNGRVLTAKQLPEASYQAIHKLPHGERQLTIKKLLMLAASYAKQAGPGWHNQLLADRLELRLK